MTTPRRF